MQLNLKSPWRMQMKKMCTAAGRKQDISEYLFQRNTHRWLRGTVVIPCTSGAI